MAAVAAAIRADMKRELSLLVIEDMAEEVELIDHELRRAGLPARSQWVQNQEQLVDALAQQAPDVILSDHAFPGFDGFRALDLARQRCPEVPFIFVTGAHGDEAAVEALKHGADDYVLKSRLQLLAPAIERALREAVERARRREAEEALRQSQEQLRLLEADYRELQELTQALGRGMQTPLRHLEGLAELLRSAAGGPPGAKGRARAAAMVESAGQMGRLLDELLSYCRVGRGEMNRMRFSLADTVKEVLSDLSREAEGREVEWVLGELPEVVGDPALVWLALSGLIANALKFTRLRERARIEIGSTSTEREVIVRVADNGTGFDARECGRLFGVFQRLHPPGEFEGLGIGLAKVRRIARRHGGRTWAEGAPGKGASFFLSLTRPPPRRVATE
jgi:signal transduction histidine kinase